MAVATRHPAPVHPPQPAGLAGRRSGALPSAALTVETVALSVLVGAAGSAGRRAARVLAVLLIGAAATWLERRDGHLARAISAAVLGVLGLVTGTGIGVMHLVKSDVDAVALAGIGSLGSGLVLFALGVVRLWRATPGWWRVAALPIALVVVEFVLIPCTAAIYATNLPATALGNVTPAARGFAYLDVTLTTVDHVRLSAWYIPSRNGAAIVLLHGSGSTRTSVLDQATVIARHGYGVLLVDARGHGRSRGIGMDFGWWGDRDTLAAVTWLEARPDVAGGRVGAVGMSMGGEEALGAAAADPRIRVVVTEGALGRGSMDSAWLPNTPQGYIERGMLTVQTAVTGLLTSAPEPASLRRAVVAIAPRPVLLIAGRPELRGDRQLRDAAPATVDVWELPDTPHVSGLAYHPAEWEARVVGFLDAALGPSTP